MASFVQWLFKKMGATLDIDSTSMTAEQAVKYPPVFYGVRKIGTHVGMLPCNLRLRTGESTTIQTEHQSHQLLKVRPNAYQTPSFYKQQLMTHAVLWGNGRSYIHRIGNRPAELIPLMPDRTVTQLLDGVKWHATKPIRNDRFDLLTDMRKSPDEVVMMTDDQVVHLPGFSFDGISGLSLYELAAQSIGLGIDSEKHSAKQLRKGYAGGLMLEAPAGAFRKGDEAQEFLTDFRKTHEGSDNAGKVGMLREGIKANMLSMSNVDAQFAEQRKFQRQDAALWLMLESILGDDASVSYNSLEQKLLAYLMNCLGPWLTTLEEELNAKLITDNERRKGFYFKFNDGALLRSDKASLMDFCVKGMQSHILTQNEARALFDMNPVDDGDKFFNPSITPGTPGEPPPAPAQKTVQPPKKANANAAVESQLRHMIRVEAKRVVQHSEETNYLTWMDRWYSEWESTLADKLEELGLDRDLATVHCTESKRLLLEAANAKADVFKTILTQCVASWERRVYSMLGDDVGLELQRAQSSSDIALSIANIAESIANRKPPDVYITIAKGDPPVVNVTTPSPVVNITTPSPVVNVSTPEQNITVASSPPNITVISATQEAPIVKITNEVQPASVNVTIPSRRTKTTITRDRSGVITGSDQIEEDA